MKQYNPLPTPRFINEVIDKHQLKNIIAWAFSNYGIARATCMADKLKDLGFQYATKAGISLSLEDLKIPPMKKKLLYLTIKTIEITERKYSRGEITVVEKFQKVIDTWNYASESLKNEALSYFKIYDPLNPVYLMSFSGARGNISQVRQLVGMRGLMSDPQGQIIDLPIASNFREGLTVTEYFISSYGARKGLVDTALRTADSGYLTRRLVDVVQDVIIREKDCTSNKGIILENMFSNQRMVLTLGQSLIGRVCMNHLLLGTLIGKVNQDIDSKLANFILNKGIKKVLVRSPLTCDSLSSVCQYCYGWSLAHGSMVDIGESVGIIAAQSIGEPGTQLTMRTFHTGGVFTGEFAEQIYAPTSGKIIYPDNYKVSIIRTRHGESAFKLEENMQLSILNQKNHKYTNVLLYRDSILFYKNQDVIYEKDIIAEMPMNNRLEQAQKYIVADISGEVYFSDLIVEETRSKNYTSRITKKGGTIWVLSGQVYDIPDMAEVTVVESEKVTEQSILSRLQLKNKHAGKIKLIKNNSADIKEIQIITDSIQFKNPKMSKDVIKGKYILELASNEKFLLRVSHSMKIRNGHVIGDLISNIYHTKTGGIIKYLDLPVSTEQVGIDKEGYEILGPGYILWISEETHDVNKDKSQLLVSNGDIVEPGHEILKNIFCKTHGIVHIIYKEDIVKEVIIKPGKIYPISSTSIIKGKTKGFLRPGEKTYENLTSDKLVYWELIEKGLQTFIIIRPIIVYSILDRNKTLEQELIQTSYEKRIKLRILRKVNFKDGERVKSINGVELIQTQLVLDIDTDTTLNSNLIAYMELIMKQNTLVQLQFIALETISIRYKYHATESFYIDNIHMNILVKDEECIVADTVLAQAEIISKSEGIVQKISGDTGLDSNRRILILTSQDKYLITFPSLSYKSKFQVGDWIYQGDKLFEEQESPCSGQILEVTEQQIFIRIARPYLVSINTILYINHQDLLKQSETIAILVFDRAKTGDIVQGLPRIEEILEVRKNERNKELNPHAILDTYFINYCNLGLNIQDATQLTFQSIQSFLINEVQLVYQSQGVDISDKHLEIIISRMTEKVKIITGGSTGYLLDEVIEFKKICKTNHYMIINNKEIATYKPILLGITKASLNTTSFISAASFQETTKVLTDAAIMGRIDWLRGLKENVIIGRLIPAGTGFNIHNHTIMTAIGEVNNMNQPLYNSLEKIDIDIVEH
uniref:RNA polymerase beta'' subunit n=1 Tax=Dixoniella grisea TaxID=35153 RepID=UPI001FCCC25C|nr:RNA polymerase beta'' subunit [Dixoniella grisea]UNJ17116.1 RNA polymerase beta'' subunit [Dixoniella grisea]